MRAHRSWQVWATFLVLVVAGALAVFTLQRRAVEPPWPDHVLVPGPGSPEEVVAQLLDAITRADWEAAAALATTRYGLDQPAMARQLELGMQGGGDLTRWAITAAEPGDPVLVTVVCQFSWAGRVTLEVEVFAEAGGWRVGNMRSRLTLPEVDWLTAGTERLRLQVWPGHRGDLELLVRAGEQGFDQALGPLLAGEEPLPEWAVRPVTVYVLDSNRSLAAAFGQSLPEWAVGTTHENAVLVVSSSGMGRGDHYFCQIFVHELNHLLFWRYARARDPVPAAIPAWLSEGMAGLAAGQLQGERREGFLQSLPARLPSPGDLAEPFVSNPLPGWYEYAFALAEYLTLRHGPDALRRLVDMIGDGRTGAGALIELTGVTVEELTADWHEWLRRGMRDD